MNTSRRALPLLVAALLFAQFAEAQRDTSLSTTKRFSYQGVPILLDIQVGTESRVHFGESVEFGLPGVLAESLDVSSVHGIVYLTAREGFDRQRVAIKGKTSGRIVLIDLAASTSGTGFLRDIYIHPIGTRVNPVVRPKLTMAQFMRFAAQQTLAAKRTKTQLPGVRHASVKVAPNSLYRDFAVQTELHGVWRSHEWIALAVELRNESAKAITLDPQVIGGSWHVVGFLHLRLLPKGKLGATTVMFLVGAHDAVAELRG